MMAYEIADLRSACALRMSVSWTEIVCKGGGRARDAERSSNFGSRSRGSKDWKVEGVESLGACESRVADRCCWKIGGGRPQDAESFDDLRVRRRKRGREMGMREEITSNTSLAGEAWDRRR